MKKIVWLVLLILSVSLIGGCAEKSNKNSGEPVTITLWHYYNDDIKAQFDEMVRLFNETVGAEKGIIVDAYSQGGVNELADAVYASAQEDIGSNPMPDIFAAYSDNAFRLDKMGVVAELDSYFTEDELNRYRAEFIADGRFSEDGKLKIFPVAKSTELLYINRHDFEQFSKATGTSIDSLRTWEGLAQTAAKYYEWCGKAFFGMDSLSNFMIQASKQLGDDIISGENGKASFNLSKESAKKIWDCCYVPYIRGYYQASGRFRSDDVKSGVIISFVGSSSSASYFPKFIETGKDTGYETSSFVMPYPYFEGMEKYCVQQGAGMVVTKSTEEKERACVEFLKWMTKPEQNIKFTAATSYMPVENESLTYEATVSEIGTSDETDVRVQTAKALYEMLDEYTLYALKPFDNSIGVRNILDHSLNDLINADLHAIEERKLSGEESEALYEEYEGEENFNKWYETIANEINSLY